MRPNDDTSSNEYTVNQLIEKYRISFSRMFKMYLELYEDYHYVTTELKEEKKKPKTKDFSYVKTDSKIELTERHFIRNNHSYYDEIGKVNWEIIRRFMQLGIESTIKKEYPILNENEIKLICLYFFRISPKIISHILPYKEASISPKVLQIKKKTGLEDFKKLFEIIMK